MESTRHPAEGFSILRDGRIIIPDWAAELLIIFMVYTPNSWADNAARLKCIPAFQPAINVYSLVYTFCVAMNSRNPLLLGFALYDEATGMYSMAPHVASMYEGESNPLDFWTTLQGQQLRATAAEIRASAEARASAQFFFNTHAESLAHEEIIEHFCDQVDAFRNVPHSVNSLDLHGAIATTNL